MATGGQDIAGSYVPADQMFVSFAVQLHGNIMLTNIDLGLQVLDGVIMTRWKVLPREQCQGELTSFCE